MSNLIRAVLCVSAISFLSSEVHAQFGKILGGGGSSGPSPEQIVKSYVAGAKSVLLGQNKLLLALNHKEQAERAAQQAQGLTEGATKDSLEDAVKVQTDNSKLIESSLQAQNVAMDATAKAHYAEGLGHLGTGVLNYMNLSKDVKSFKPGVGSLGSGVQAAAYVAQTLPSNASNLSSSLSAAVKFAQSNNIDVPSNATALLK